MNYLRQLHYCIQNLNTVDIMDLSYIMQKSIYGDKTDGATVMYVDCIINIWLFVKIKCPCNDRNTWSFLTLESECVWMIAWLQFWCTSNGTYSCCSSKKQSEAKLDLSYKNDDNLFKSKDLCFCFLQGSVHCTTMLCVLCLLPTPLKWLWLCHCYLAELWSG